MRTSHIRSFFAGMLIANSAPHIASAAAGRQHMTPIGGRDSSALVNGAWAAMNLAGGIGLLAWKRARPQADGRSRRWGSELLAFETGCVVFALWMGVSERLLRTNTRH